MDVTVLIDISFGANITLAIRSENIQKKAPPKKQAGIIMIGFEVLKRLLTRCGTATPRNEIGPANAVTQAARMLEMIIIHSLKLLIFTPILFA